jgi:decaprenylphospho-beta-D-ribofuranose 2-oxidase
LGVLALFDTGSQNPVAPLAAFDGYYSERSPPGRRLALATQHDNPRMTLISGWGRCPSIDALVHRPSTLSALTNVLDRADQAMIARGLGRSYGDASLAAQVVALSAHDHFIAFDREDGVLECGAGTSLDAILNLVVPSGWFLAVTPGTAQVTLGGAIASDVHGKNHHQVGAFSDHIASLRLMTADGEIKTCSASENVELFRATAGGMGLTGIIIDAVLKLIRVASSFIDERILRADNLAHAVNLLDAQHDATYAVAWIDAMASGPARGRGLVMLGEHATDASLQATPRRAWTVPLDAPSGLLNRPFMRAFNVLYFQRLRSAERRVRSHYSNFFHPLDGIKNWPRLYGRRGLLQYQCVVPRESGEVALALLLDELNRRRIVSPLAVLKILGAGNQNLLSFPRAGYTLALDLPRNTATLELLKHFDAVVRDHGGRVYLAKDACMSTRTFKGTYPTWLAFEEMRARHGASGRFRSLLSQRLGLD